MKFRRKNSHEEFDHFCMEFCGDYYDCQECPIGKEIYNVEKDIYEDDEYCVKWVDEHPKRAAELMGYEIVGDVQDFRKKPIGEWTLNECKSICKCIGVDQDNLELIDKLCTDCELNKICATLIPEWKLKEKSRLTDDEIAICKLFGAKWVSREGPTQVTLWKCHPERVNGFMCGERFSVIYGEIIKDGMFKFVKMDDCICVKEFLNE